MDHKLTWRQDAFARELAKGASNADAYRRSYTLAHRSQNALYVAASELARNPKVAVRVEQLRARAMLRHDVNTDSLLAEADAALNIAANKADAGGMVQATRLKAMLLGLLGQDRREPRPSLVEMSDEQVIAELEQLRAERTQQAWRSVQERPTGDRGRCAKPGWVKTNP